MAENDESAEQQPTAVDEEKIGDPGKEFGKRLRSRLTWLKTDPDFAPYVFEDPMISTSIEQYRGVRPVSVYSFRPVGRRQMEIYKPGGEKSERDVIGLASHGTNKEPETLFFYEVESDGTIEGFRKPQNGPREQIPPDAIDHDELAKFLDPTLYPADALKKEVPLEARLVGRKRQEKKSQS